VVACGGAGDGRMDADAAAGSDAGSVELAGRFEMSGPAPYNHTMTNATLRCQRATPASPFRAQWEDQAAALGILVTGWPQTDGTAHRVDLFQVVHILPGGQEQARLSGATLSVEELSSSGRVSTYAVEATGTFEGSGTFRAMGNCQA